MHPLSSAFSVSLLSPEYRLPFVTSEGSLANLDMICRKYLQAPMPRGASSCSLILKRVSLMRLARKYCSVGPGELTYLSSQHSAESVLHLWSSSLRFVFTVHSLSLPVRLRLPLLSFLIYGF